MKKYRGRKSRDTAPLTKIENILTLWSVAQAGLNDEKLEVEILLDCPFKICL